MLADWLQVGQSYSNAAAPEVNGGSTTQQECQDSSGTLTFSREAQLLPRSNTRKCKASDFFGGTEKSVSVASESGSLGATPKESNTSNDGDGSREGGAAKTGAGKKRDETTRKRKRKKRPSSLSDEDTDSGRDTPTRHRKIGECVGLYVPGIYLNINM